MIRYELKRVRRWADDKMCNGREPPRSWYQYAKLVEALDAIPVGMEPTCSVPALAALPAGAERRTSGRVRLVDDGTETADPPSG
jgi:hypothetical protein